MVSGFMCAHKGHEYIICSAVWLPLALFFVQGYLEEFRIPRLIWTAVPLSLSILAGFPQIALYSCALVLLYLIIGIFHSPKIKGWKVKLRQVLGAACTLLLLTGLLASLPIFAVAETLPYLTRERLTYEMFTSDSFPPWQALTFIIPNLFGGVDRDVPMYGPATTVFAAEVYPYLGLLPLALALYCFTVRFAIGFPARFWMVATIVALLLAFGGMTPLYRLLFYVPIYNLFRVPARHLFEVNFAMSVLAALGLDHLLRPPTVRRAEKPRRFLEGPYSQRPGSRQRLPSREVSKFDFLSRISGQLPAIEPEGSTRVRASLLILTPIFGASLL